MRPSNFASRHFNSNENLLLPLIEFMSKSGQFHAALALLDTFTDKPYDPMHQKQPPHLQPKKADLIFLFAALKKYETDINLLEKTVTIMIKINDLHAQRSDNLFIPEDISK